MVESRDEPALDSLGVDCRGSSALDDAGENTGVGEVLQLKAP